MRDQNDEPLVANIADAGFSGSDNLTDSDASLGATTQGELEGVLQDFGNKINSILSALEAAGIVRRS